MKYLFVEHELSEIRNTFEKIKDIYRQELKKKINIINKRSTSYEILELIKEKPYVFN